MEVVMHDHKAAKKRYWKRVHNAAPVVECACGCGTKIKSKDKYGRDKRFVNGHNNRKYDDPKQYKREWNHRNRESRQLTKKKRWRHRKAVLIRMSGGKCSRCPLTYNGENGALFDFHHKDPEGKLFNLNAVTLVNRAWAKILAEHDKCELVCSNCHRLLHSDKF
jgi:hypothetical protein